MTARIPDTHLRFLRAVRGAVAADAVMGTLRSTEAGWDEVREAWTRPQRNWRPTPWDGWVGKPSTRASGAHSREFVGSVRLRPVTYSPLRVFIDEHSYYYDLPSGTPTPALVTTGPARWRYVGQAVFSVKVQPYGGRWFPPKAAPITADFEREVDHALRPGVTRKVDSAGRLWVLVDVDRAALRARVEAYDAKHKEPGDDPYPGRGYARYLPSDEGGYFGIPPGYTTTYCTGSNPATLGEILAGTASFVANHSSDPLTKSSRPFHSRAEKFVLLGGGTGCTGTIMDGNNILTAAHCLGDRAADMMDVTTISACTYANDACSGSRSRSSCSVPSGRSVDCAGGAETVLIGAYGGSLDSEDDFAVLKLQTRLQEVDDGLIDEMYMSKRKSSLADWDAHTRGYPSGTPDSSSDVCNTNRLNAAISSADGASTAARDQYSTSGWVDAVLSATINFILGSASGMSGGAMYYCWESDCADGHGQTSIQSLYTGLSLNGPRSADFRTAVLGVV